MIDYPKVSVCIITYNHENFIEKTLSSIIMQKTAFPFEIIISNDCSTDATDKKIRDFIESYPSNNIIYHDLDMNIGANNNFIFVQKKALGKYIAFCEGDDYWIDDFKLQKQYDLLEKNREISLCFTSRVVVDENDILINDNKTIERNWTSKEIALGAIPPLQTVFSKNYALGFEEFMQFHSYSYGSDKIYAYFLSLKGRIFSLSDVTAAYRIHRNGVWSRYSNLEKEQLHISQSLLFFKGISETLMDEKKLRNSFFKKILVTNMMNFLNKPGRTIKNVSTIIFKYQVSLFSVSKAFYEFISYYVFLLKKKLWKV